MSTSGPIQLLQELSLPATQCGCCDGTHIVTPVSLVNVEGLSAIAYRVGTYATFKESLFAGLSESKIAGLRTRESDDFTIALLDAFAVMADVLTFYQERIANENYLRTATEMSSLAGLSELIGYRLRPGTAASAFVAFNINTPPATPPGTPVSKLPQGPGASQDPAGFPRYSLVPVGTKIQSIPSAGQLPATFETIEAITARLEWNALTPATTVPYNANVASRLHIWTPGPSTTVATGDWLIVVARNASVPVLCAVAGVSKTSVGGQPALQLTLSGAAGADPVDGLSLIGGSVPNANGQQLNSAVVKPIVAGLSLAQEEMVAFAARLQWPLAQLDELVDAVVADSGSDSLRVYAVAAQAALFGHNAADYEDLPFVLRYGDYVLTDLSKGTYTAVAGPYPNKTQWVTPLAIAGSSAQQTVQVYLDRVYIGIAVGARVALVQGGTQLWGTVAVVAEESHTDWLVTARVTRIDISLTTAGPQVFDRRLTRVYIQGAAVTITDPPVTTPVGAAPIVLDRCSLNMFVGQRVLLTGERIDKPGQIVCEAGVISDLDLDNGYTVITLSPGLQYQYRPDTVSISANVAAATHGETRGEVLGSGDGSVPFQQFTLKQPPLTYLSAAVPSGVSSTLSVRVNGIEWTEVPSLYNAGPSDRVFITRRTGSGQTVVQFGDGVNGSRLPTGIENVEAVYRQGIGVAGMVGPKQLSMLLTRPLGVKDASNPNASEGGQEPETVDQSRANAPLTMRTIDRVVSLQDYEDAARAFAGVARALVTRSWDGHQYVVVLTLAGTAGATIDPGGLLASNLLTALSNAGDTQVLVSLASYTPVYFTMEGSVTVDPSYDAIAVKASIDVALRTYFDFSQREFGQPVTLSETIATIAGVDGVVGVTLTRFYRVGSSPADWLPEKLFAELSTFVGTQWVGAEQLQLDPGYLSKLAVSK